MKRHLLLPIIALVLAIAAWGASSDSKETRELKLRLKAAQLELQQAKAARTKAESSYKESQDLFTKGLYTKSELAGVEDAFEQAKLRESQAEINLEHTRLAFLNDALRVTLVRASLFLDQKRERHVRLTLKNNSNIDRIIDDEAAYSQSDKSALLSIDNLTVRLSEDGKLIGRPFENTLARLPYGQLRDVDFVLQRQTDAVTVEITYADTSIMLPVYLQSDATNDRALIESMQFSQDGELESKVKYLLSVTRYVEERQAIALDVVNLPGLQFQTKFVEINESTGAEGPALSSILFQQDLKSKTIALIVNMPKDLSAEKLDKPMQFFVVALDRAAQQRLSELKQMRKGVLTQTDLDSMQISNVMLELVPRGKAEITIEGPNLFLKKRIGEPLRFQFDLQNTGTVNLDGILVSLQLPANWAADIKPERDITLEVQYTKRIDVELLPASDATAGDYEIKLGASTFFQSREVTALEKVLRLQLETRSNVFIAAIFMIVLIGLIVGVSIFTIKIARR
jgi:hypothetical protein